MKTMLKKIIPNGLLKILRPIYHGVVAYLASWYFGNPSEKLVVVGITGTAGKSTTTAILSRILNGNNKKTGYITTVSFFNGEKYKLNKHGLSMPGGWLLQKQLKQMVSLGCKYAVVECTSEGLAQNRHLGINFDIALFTNLSPAHLKSHGSYGNYQKAKARLFEKVGKCKRKSFFPKKMIGVNFDDALSGIYYSCPADVKFGVSFTNIKMREDEKIFYGKVLKNGEITEFEIDGVDFKLNMIGDFNAQNAGLATACGSMLGVSVLNSAKALESFTGVPGRMEMIENNFGFKIIVDYGCEPASFRVALESASLLPKKKLIHVFGSTGGHRDTDKQFEFGKISAGFADHIIVTNDDVYESDPNEIANNIVEGIKGFKLRQPTYEIVLDRKEAILKALTTATVGDEILITGKGSEQFLVLPENKRIDWDDREVVRDLLNQVKSL
jgi:UDP-N-acetylmuramoyl-L-alanyl-D-glutamate--2,6-diaminopimelate ligase